MPWETRAGVGTEGEAAALRVYLRRGFQPIARNWRCPAGEIDLVVQNGGLVVFCEVKSRRGAAFGGGYEAVTWRKQRKLTQLAEQFLLERRLHPSAVRFDVASIWLSGGQPSVEIFQDAF